MVDELEKDELEDYSEKVKVRLMQMKKVWHDERRAKEAAMREQEEALAYAKRVAEENKKMRQMITSGEKEYVETIQSSATMQLEMAKKKATAVTKLLPAIFTPHGVASALLSPLVLAFNGKTVFEGASPLKDKLGKN